MNFDFLDKYRPYALAALRIVTALAFMAHGTQKLFGFPAMGGPMGDGPGGPGGGVGGGGMDLLSMMGIAGILEVFGGAAILLGFFTRPVAFLLAGEMAVAFWFMHVPMARTVIPVANGGDAAALFCFIFLYLVFAGAGAWSLDGAWRPRSRSAAA